MKYSILIVAFTLTYWSCTGQKTKRSSEPEDIASFTKHMQHLPGYFDVFWDAKSGKIWLKIARLEDEFLYVQSLAAGIGSNDIGLDRGQIKGEKVVKFVRVGPKVLLVHKNYDYRAISDNSAEQKSVEEAFAQSVLGGFTVELEDVTGVLVNATEFLLQDAHGVDTRLKSTGQGTYKLDPERSAIYLDRTKSFPENTEFESTLTFGLEARTVPGAWVNSVVPSPQSITVRQHHSFVKLPDADYEMRVLDPRSGFFGISYHDYATPISQPLMKRFIQRHRLKKKDPQAVLSEAVEPIIYYVDPGAPEPIRSALIEGASWWNQAFEAVGYKDAFQVQVLPEGVDPLDVRYNVIQWVHRSTRGWSYGNTVADPRTGEIIKGHVSLGSLRVRQDFLIAQGLVEAYKEGPQADPRLLEMALARLRQLSAHEVGHTLGLNHNFTASTNDRSSVMDYPHPLIKSVADQMDFSEAYDDKIGAWDKRTILYGYQDFAERTNVNVALQAILKENDDLGLRYITDRDARPIGGAHPFAHLWDNGAQASEEMQRMLALRAAALDKFGANNLAPGTPWASLEEVLAPLYLSHRYQSEAVVKLIGGVNYQYTQRHDDQPSWSWVSAEAQRTALTTMLQTLSAETLAMPTHIRELIPPKPPTYQRGRESFKSRTGVTFDPIAAAESAASNSLRLLLNPQRATRLVQQKAFDSSLLGLDTFLKELVHFTWKQAPDDAYELELYRVVSLLTLRHLIDLALSEEASVQAQALIHYQIETLESWIAQNAKRATSTKQKAHYHLALARIKQFKNDPDQVGRIPEVKMPDGSPIGATMRCGLLH